MSQSNLNLHLWETGSANDQDSRWKSWNNQLEEPSLKKLLKVFTRLIATEELRDGEGGDLCRMELAVFQKTFEFGLTDASMLLK